MAIPYTIWFTFLHCMFAAFFFEDNCRRGRVVHSPRARRDQQLGDKLALGEGCSSSSTKVPVGPHVSSYLTLQPAAKRPKTLRPENLDDDLLLRITQVAEVTFTRTRHLSVANDGVRVGGKDVVYYHLASSCDERYRSCWALLEKHIFSTVSSHWILKGILCFPIGGFLENTFCADLTLPLILWAAAQGPARIVVYLKSPPDFSPGRLLKEMVRSAPENFHLIF